MQGTITSNGTIAASTGTIEMLGSAAQTLGANLFSSNTINNLIINNTCGVALLGTLNVTGIVTVSNGNLSSDGNLILNSSVAKTALIDGSGLGNITGNVTMQRYIPSGFGYKYFSSPFQAASVSEFGDDMNLTSAFTTFYKYDESRIGSGWVNYKTPANILIPLTGYAVNFGSNAAANTVDITGIVNNGAMSVSLFNHNNAYTKGFNLAGNPYPSPIDWNLVKAYNTNVDDAVYYFKASTTDQYGGSYSTYINGLSSDGIVNNVIPSMQGFFVHVSDGSYPVSGTLSMNNSVRISDLSHPFASKKGSIAKVPLIRLTARFTDDISSADPMVLYFDEKGAPEFDSRLDALKLLNTDLKIVNLYSLSPDGTMNSINALPEVSGDNYTVPLGIKLNRTGTGTIIIKIQDIDESLSGLEIYFNDRVTGTSQDLIKDKEYSIALAKGEYNNRFFINLSKGTNITTNIPEKGKDDDFFKVYSSSGILKAEIHNLNEESGTLLISNLVGQILYREKVYESGYKEFDPSLKDGLYIVSYFSGKIRYSKKILIQNR
jgi:fibronectin-binding autotransporter adhesin